MAQNNTLIIVGAIIVIALVLAPTIISEAFTGIRDFFSDFRDAFFEDWGDFFDSTNATGGFNHGSLQFTIHYKDGRTEVIKQDFSILPLIIEVGGGAIERVDASLLVTMTFTEYAQVSTWDINGDLELQVVSGGHSQIWQTNNYSKSGSSWTNGETKTIHQHSFNADTLEQYLHDNYPVPEESQIVYVYYNVDSTLKIDFADGQSYETLIDENRLGAFAGFWTPSGINGLQVELKTTPI